MLLSAFSYYRFLLPVCTLVFVLCLLPEHQLPHLTGVRRHLPLPIDKIVHFAMFFGVAGAAFLDHTRRLKTAALRAEIWGGSLIFPVFFGGAIELAQAYFTATRTGDWLDWLADAAGAATAFGLCRAVNRRLPVASSLPPELSEFPDREA